MKRKKIRERGKIRLSRYFNEFNIGDTVAVVKEPAVDSNFLNRIYGETGKVLKKIGRAYSVQIKKKKFLIRPIHLKKIK